MKDMFHLAYKRIVLNVLIILLTLYLNAFLACSSRKLIVEKEQPEKVLNNNEKPSWIYNGKHPKYSYPKYIIGVGLSKGSDNPANDRQLADQSAYSKIAEQIIAHVSSDISIEQIEVSRDKVVTILERTIANTRAQTSLTLKGLTIAERYYDENEDIYYSLGILNRTVASASYRSELLKHQTNYYKYLKEADQYFQIGKIYQSLISLREAMNASFLYEEVLPWYKLLAFSDDSNESKLFYAPSPIAVLNSLTEKLSRIQLNIIKGNKQKYIIGKPLNIPLTVHVSIKGEKETPINNFPIHFYFEKGRGDIIKTTRTDTNGIASSLVKKIEPSKSEIYMVAAELNFEKLKDTAAYALEWNKHLSSGKRKVLFQFERKKSSIPAKVLIIIEHSNQYTTNNSIAEEIFSQELSNIGLNPVNKSDIEGTNIKTISDAVQKGGFSTLHTLLPESFEFIIVGKISVNPLSKVQGMKIFTVNGFIKAVSLKNNLTLSEDYLQNVRGFGITEKQAAEDAINKASFKAVETIIADILSNL